VPEAGPFATAARRAVSHQGRVGGRHALLACVLLLPLATLASADTPGSVDCGACHEQAQNIAKSVHAKVGCLTCHPGHETIPHPKGIPKPTCGQCHTSEASQYAESIHGQQFNSGNEAAPNCAVCHGDIHQVADTHTWAFKKSIPDLCGACHADIAGQYHASIHGQGLEQGIVDVPVCTTCHQAHLVLAPTNPSSPVYPTHIRETCGQCHGNVRLASQYGLPVNRLLTYDASFHGMMTKEGSVAVANCASCHGIHLILPSSDPRSSINPQNLPQTCGKCHPGAGTRFAIGPIHEIPGALPDKWSIAIRWVRAFYLTLIPLLIGLMFLHNLGDWIRKLRRARFPVKAPPAEVEAEEIAPADENEEVRMYPFERLEHILLLVSFILLVWTGFALRYPAGWWQQPLRELDSSGRHIRGLIHRIAAVVFIAVGVLHLISLIRRGRLREHWKSLWPRLEDVREAFANFAYNLGLRRERPQLSSHSYVEKTEYWAVVWGAVVMTLTGLMLWANKLMLAWLPKSFLDLAATIHLYEAILAALAILVWHFYSVIFDPEVYPMDAAWLTGRSPRRRNPEPDAEPGAGSDDSAAPVPAEPDNTSSTPK
jgi:cytochrome b subunit of formate dehydrogenase